MTQEQLASGFLVLVIVLPFVWAITGLVRSRYHVGQTLLLWGAVLLARLLWRAKLPDGVPLPPDQGGVIVCNHRSSVDPFFLQVCAGRPIHWMVAREYCDHPAFRWFLSSCEVIPVNRGGVDTAATKAAIRMAADGGLIGMFPEGRINMSDEFMLPVRPGAILVALKARVPVLPCYVEGSPYLRTPWSPFFRGARVRVTFGEPIDLSPHFDKTHEDGFIAALMIRVVSSLARIAGRDEFQPVLAGRRWKPTEEELESAMQDSTRRARRRA